MNKTRAILVRCIVVCCIMVLSRSGAEAQTSGTVAAENQDPGEAIFVGPAFSLGQGFLLGSNPPGWTTAGRFTWSVGGIGSYALTEGLSVDLGIAYDVRGVYLADSVYPRPVFETKYHYLSIRPAINFGGLFIGAGVGIPLGSTTVPGDSRATYATITGSSSDMSMLIEARVGFQIPVLQSDFGELRIMLNGSYAFTKLLSNIPDQSQPNGPIATIGVGATYLFKFSPF